MEGTWKNIVLNKYKDWDLDYIFGCNTTYIDFPLVQLKTFDFWKEVLITWCCTNYESKLYHPDRIRGQHLWYNSNIKVGGKTVFYRKWCELNIKKIKDLMKEDNPFMSYDEFCGKLCNFFEYAGLIRATPKEWKNIVKQVDRIYGG